MLSGSSHCTTMDSSELGGVDLDVIVGASLDE